MSPIRSTDDVRIEILCEKLKEASLSVEERDGLADDLRRAEQCMDPGTKDILISNVRRAMSEPVRVRREIEGALAAALDKHEVSCSRASTLDRSLKELHGKVDLFHQDYTSSKQPGSSLELPLPKVLGGKTLKVSGGAVYLFIFVVSVLIFMKVNRDQRNTEAQTIHDELQRMYFSGACPSPTNSFVSHLPHR